MLLEERAALPDVIYLNDALAGFSVQAIENHLRQGSKMADPVWLDTNAVTHLLMGDVGVNDLVAKYRKEGRRLLMAPASWAELLTGNTLTYKKDQYFKRDSDGDYPKDSKGKRVKKKNPKFLPFHESVPSATKQDEIKKALKAMSIEQDLSGNSISPEKRMEYHDIKTNHTVTPSDRLVVSQVKAGAEAQNIKNAIFITGDSVLVKEASSWGLIGVEAKATGSALENMPRVSVKGYPEDNDRPVTKFFRDMDVWEKLKLTGFGILANVATSGIMNDIQNHFSRVIGLASQDLKANHPTPAQLRAKADPDAFLQAYSAALSKMQAPQRAKMARDFILVGVALKNPKDVDRVRKVLDDQIAKVKSAADGSIKGFADIAEEYIDALLKLRSLNLKTAENLPEAVVDVTQRSEIVTGLGNELDAVFWKHLTFISVFPLVGYAWMDLHTTADIFRTLGARLGGFASEIDERLQLYVKAIEILDKELLSVSEQLGKYDPTVDY